MNVLVLTADLIDSSTISIDQRALVHHDLEHIICAFSDQVAIYRGDTFQIVLKDYGDFLTKVLELKAALRARQYGDYPLDARAGIGIGEVNYLTDQVSTSDGPAFAMAAEALESCYTHASNIRIKTADRHANVMLNALLGLLDTLAQEWTQRQAEIMQYALQNHTQAEIARRLGVAQSTVQRSLTAGHHHIIQEVLENFTEIIAPYEL